MSSALVSCPQLDGVLTGDSTGALRYWNLGGQPSRSNYLSGPLRRHASHWAAADVFESSTTTTSGGARSDVAGAQQSRITYAERTPPQSHDSTIRVQVEQRPPSMTMTAAAHTKTEPAQIVPHVSDCHRDAITDLIAVGDDQLVSAGRDGVIKIWRLYVA